MQSLHLGEPSARMHPGHDPGAHSGTWRSIWVKKNGIYGLKKPTQSPITLLRWLCSLLSRCAAS